MNKNYTVFDLLNLWEEDLLKNEIKEEVELDLPSNRVLSNILSYANSFTVYSNTLNTNLELCLN